MSPFLRIVVVVGLVALVGFAIHLTSTREGPGNEPDLHPLIDEQEAADLSVPLLGRPGEETTPRQPDLQQESDLVAPTTLTAVDACSGLPLPYVVVHA